MSSKIERDVELILNKVEQVPSLHDKIDELHKKVDILDGKVIPLQIEAAISEENRAQCAKRHTTLNTMLIVVLGALLALSGFALERWASVTLVGVP